MSLFSGPQPIGYLLVIVAAFVVVAVATWVMETRK